jgi:[acyl-carrier-protein] S-malonyltransferase
VVEPYRRIQKMQEELEAQGSAPSMEQQELALQMLKDTFTVKQTPIAEQHERFASILTQCGLTTQFSQYLATAEVA